MRWALCTPGRPSWRVALAIITTLLLYLAGAVRLSQKLTRPDILAKRQFWRGVGDYSGLSCPIARFWPVSGDQSLRNLADGGADFRGELVRTVMQWRCACWARKSAGRAGLVGGMVSSTATSMSFARQVRDDPGAAFCRQR